jgi:hypothetical protein
VVFFFIVWGDEFVGEQWKEKMGGRKGAFLVRQGFWVVKEKRLPC